MKAWKVILATLVIFCAGGLVGGLVVKEFYASNPAPAPVTWSGQTRLQTLLRRMDRELALTPEQHDQIERIVSACQERMRELSKPVSLEGRKETASTLAQIRGLLTPDQQVKFDTFSKTRSSRSEHAGHGDADDHDGRAKWHGDHDFDAMGMTNFNARTN